MGYTHSQIQLVRSGRPLYVDDGPLHFAVHPYLFSLKKDAIDIPPKLNWENIDAKFIQPDALHALQTVPLLAETLARVALPPSQATALERIAADRSHGAAELAVWVLDTLHGKFLFLFIL